MTLNLIVGAGFSGATLAYLIKKYTNDDVIVIDKKSHIAGNSFDFRDKNGIMIHKYGSHIFHTNNDNVWKFVSEFSSFNQYMHKVIAIIDGIETTIPFNFNTIYDVFPNTMAQKIEEKLLKKFEYNKKVPILEFQNQDDKDLKFLADYIYQNVFLHYSAKQWGLNLDEMDSSVAARVPVYLSKDNRYFQDKYQGIPLLGYSGLIKNMLKGIKVKLNTDYKDIDNSKFDRIFYTGAIDEYFNYEYGQIPYRSVDFKFEEFDVEYYQSGAVVNYPNNYDFTRIHEFKYYLNDKSSKTVISKEYSSNFVLGKNDRYYPILNDENKILYERYLKKAKDIKNLFFFGRLGDYKYYDMDKAIIRAKELFDDVFKGAYSA